MAKEQNVQVTEAQVTRNNHTVTVFTVGKTELGYIEEDGPRFLAYVAGSTAPNRFKTRDDAINFLIAEFHLHHS